MLKGGSKRINGNKRGDVNRKKEIKIKEKSRGKK